MQPLTGPYVYGVNRRSENFFLLSDLLFAWGRCTRSRYKHTEIRVVLGCVFNSMMCSKVIYSGLIIYLVCFSSIRVENFVKPDHMASAEATYSESTVCFLKKQNKTDNHYKS